MSDGFLARWARRKRDVRLTEAPEAPPPAEIVDPSDLPVVAEEGAAPSAEAEAERDLLADLPSLADLTAATDLTPFLRAGVPAAIRNAALRKMWSVDPAIRDFVSEAREYAYDWNTPGGVPGLGPLLPCDDVKAMLGRLFNAEPSDDANGDSQGSEPEPPPPDSDADVGPVSATTAPPLTAEAAPVEPPPDSAPANSANETPVTTPAVVTKQRLRRHGGAMPS